MKRLLCLLMSAVMVLGMLSGCGGSPEVQSETPTKAPLEIPIAVATEPTAPEISDPEIQKAIDLGFVPEKLQGLYDVQLSYGEFCSILDSFITAMFPEAMEGWLQASAKYHDSYYRISRMEGALVLLYAAECCGIDAVGFRYNIPLEELMADGLDFYDGVTWNYPLLPDIDKTYYNETIAGSEYAWRCEYAYVNNAIWFVEYCSYGNGKTYFDYDEQYSLNMGEAFTRGDAIRAVERLYENARFAQYVPADTVSCTVSKDTIAAGKTMPEASWQQLPEWKGYTVISGKEAAIWGAGMQYDKEYIEALGELGFDFIRAPLDSHLIFNGSDMTAVNPAFLETMDDLIEYCAEEGIHVCFDLHDMPGFYTGRDDSKIILWHDEETQKIFVEFWRFMAEYYKDVPNNLLSFNLLNEPHDMGDGPSDAVYSKLMLKAIDAIREATPERLIFVDMLNAIWGIPVQGLADAQVVQTIHPYFLRHGAEQWPAPTMNGYINGKRGTMITGSREGLEKAFQTYLDFMEKTGTLVMVQEFGFNDTINYSATLAAADDFLSVLQEYEIPWCSWYGCYGPVLDYREYQYSELFPGYPSGGMREGAEYKSVSENYMIDTGLMEVYQKYMDK